MRAEKKCLGKNSIEQSPFDFCETAIWNMQNKNFIIQNVSQVMLISFVKL